MSLRSGPSACLAAMILAAACGGKAAPTAPTPPTPTPTPAPDPEPTAPLAWLVGSYAGTVPGAGAGTLDVVASEGALYAVWLGAADARVWVVDETGADAAALGLWAFRGLPAAASVVTLPGLSQGERVAVFGAADASALWTVRRDTADALVIADASAAPPFVSDPLAPSAAPSAPALAAADRLFAADVKASGADGWAAWTAPAGALYRPAGMVVGRDAVRAAMAETLAAGTLTWEPRTGRVTADDRLGFTVGSWVFHDGHGAAVARGSYITLWQRQTDGAWRVVFDTGRPRG